jgi:hypothetical protein
MPRFLALVALILLIAAPSAARHSFRGSWALFDEDCTDLYDTDTLGNGPPGGSVDLTVLTNWDTFSEAYDIQANIGALAQVSRTRDSSSARSSSPPAESSSSTTSPPSSPTTASCSSSSSPGISWA